jgi:hypothetical protein
MSRTPPPSYARALDALAGAVQDAHALAELLAVLGRQEKAPLLPLVILFGSR